MTALHERIRSDIEGQILGGTLAPGARLPVEHELMRRYGCSRMTVSKALSRLSSSGMIERRRRAGSFVATPRAHSMILDIPDLAQEVAARGQVYAFRLLTRTVHRLPSAELGGASCWLELSGIHIAGRRPLAHETRAISLDAVPEAEDVNFTLTSPGAWLLGHVPWTEAETRIAAVQPPGQVARALGLPITAATLEIERRTWRGSEGITFVRQHFPGDAYDLVARFGPEQTPGKAASRPKI